MYEKGKLAQADLDKRAFDALKQFSVDDALAVLVKFSESNLEHVSNKSAYLCSIMKTVRKKSNPGEIISSPHRGPDQEKIKTILDRTGYSLVVTTGQRKYGGPPPGWEGAAPVKGCEVYCGKIPKDMYEDELIPYFEKCGKIWDLRLMMDAMSGLNRGFAFVTFTKRDEAKEAVKQLDAMEIAPGKALKVNVSVSNTRLFVGNIPKSKSKEDIAKEFERLSSGLVEVIIYASPDHDDDDRRQNRGFCFLEYESHKAASLAG